MTICMKSKVYIVRLSKLFPEKIILGSKQYEKNYNYNIGYYITSVVKW